MIERQKPNLGRGISSRNLASGISDRKLRLAQSVDQMGRLRPNMHHGAWFQARHLQPRTWVRLDMGLCLGSLAGLG